MDWLDLLAVQVTLKSLLQHHSSKASVLSHLDFFMVQLSHQCMTTRKAIALTRWMFVGKVMSLLFNMLSRFVIAFFPRLGLVLINLYPHRFITVSASTHPAPEPWCWKDQNRFWRLNKEVWPQFQKPYTIPSPLHDHHRRHCVSQPPFLSVALWQDFAPGWWVRVMHAFSL